MIGMLFFISSVSIFCFYNDVSSLYTEEQWCSIYEYWTMHSNRSYHPDLPNYGIPPHVAEIFSKDRYAFCYYRDLVNVVLEDDPLLGQLVDCYSCVVDDPCVLDKYIYVTPNAHIEVTYTIGADESKDQCCVEVFDTLGGYDSFGEKILNARPPVVINYHVDNVDDS